MQPLIDLLASRLPDDDSGSRSANRFAYQADWILCKAIELYAAKRDFCIVCEWHEDVLVLEKADSIPVLHLYQIKTHGEEHNWTLDRLITPKKAKNGSRPSILAKLAQRSLLFSSDFRVTANFVSNRPISDKPDNPRGCSCARTCAFTFMDIKDEQTKEKVCEAVMKQTGNENQMFINLHFHQSELNPEAHSVTAKGALSDFLEAIYPDTFGSIGSAYEALFDEIHRRSTSEKEIKSGEDLSREKALTSVEMRSMLGTICSRTRMNRIDPIMTQLQSEGVPFVRINRLRPAMFRYAAERASGISDNVEKISQVAVHVLASASGSGTLIEIAQAGVSEWKTNNPTSSWDEDTILGGMIWEIYYAELPPTNPKAANQ